MQIPSCPFDPAQSIFNGLSIISLKLGTAPALIFEATKITDDPEQATKTLDRPGKDGVVRPRRSVLTKGAEKWTFELDEVKRLLDIFDGHLSGTVEATCQLWLPDVDDDTGKCALVSEADFDVQVSRDGGVDFGGGDYSKAKIKIESLKAGLVHWDADANVSTSS